MVAVEEKNIISSYKIPFSDVVAKKRRNAIWNRIWNIRDMIYATVLVLVHLFCVFAPFYFNWKAFWVAVVLYWITGNAVTISYHRNLAHMSFKLPKVLEYFFAYCASHALQGHPIDWVSKHRFHHKYVDTERDPHSPIDGFWFSHINWILDVDYMVYKVGKRKNVADLRKQFFYVFLMKTYLLHHIALGILLYKWGGMPFLVWGMNKWWQVDIGWCVIRLLERVGLATDVKVPSESQKQKMKTYLGK
ncbi:hypothetical protein Scep_000244 [Stephania cephalantha]|uniref:Fatty acid desaturase domain-containing protein n=1 Tax=Stephania cephalantha TaxID=152367 RepID=A0AAP0Q2S9_9MAGN